ncbi:MAG TPA: TonB-dependent receptor plug domain-containing protein, partial [Bryobacteraceae bacterium]|nr:TonB-dependent receptor plug domain-containing protein [Bryobacteraceae bacterium]
MKCVRGASRVGGAAGVCALAMTAALAQTAPQPAKRTPAVVVTVTGVPMPLATESASVSLIPQEEIETSQAGDAAELLGQSAFVNVEQQGGDMAFTTMTVRGGKPNQVLVMIDGIPVNDLSNLLGGAFDFSSLALSNVERVEMVRGPMSSVYGSEAVSGVVNFITKRGARPATWTLDDGFGSFGAAQASGANRGAAGRMSYAVDAALSRIGEQTGNDGASLYTGDADLNVPVDARRVWTLVSRYATRHANEFPTGSGGSEYAVNRAAETDRTGDLVAGSSWQHQVNDVWLYRVEGNLFRRTAYNYTPPILDGTPPGPASLPSSDGHTRFSRVELRGSNLFTLGRHWSARAGGGWRRESGVSRSVL